MSMVQIIDLDLDKNHGLSTCSLLDFLLKAFTIVRLQGEKYPFFYSYIVFFN